MYDIIIST